MTGSFHWFPPLVVLFSGLVILAGAYFNLHRGAGSRRHLP
jgi:hypothetical protein